jgi:hypothetical protein
VVVVVVITKDQLLEEVPVVLVLGDLVQDQLFLVLKLLVPGLQIQVLAVELV